MAIPWKIKLRYGGFLAHMHKQIHTLLIRRLIDTQALEPENLKLPVAKMMLRQAGIIKLDGSFLSPLN